MFGFHFSYNLHVSSLRYFNNTHFFSKYFIKKFWGMKINDINIINIYHTFINIFIVFVSIIILCYILNYNSFSNNMSVKA